MEYDEGNLILTEEERELLVFATMNKIEAQYPAPYFVGSLAEIKAEAEAEARIRLLQSKQDPVEGDQLRVSVLRQLIDICDWMIERGFDAAEAASTTIKLH